MLTRCSRCGGNHQGTALICDKCIYSLAHVQPEIARLTAALERTEANRNDILADLDGVTAECAAIAAAAFEAAKDAIVSALDMSGAQMAGRYDQNKLDFHAVNTLTPADAKAALDRMLRQARAEGMRQAVALIREKWASTSAEHSDAILSRAKDMEAGNG